MNKIFIFIFEIVKQLKMIKENVLLNQEVLLHHVVKDCFVFAFQKTSQTAKNVNVLGMILEHWHHRFPEVCEFF